MGLDRRQPLAERTLGVGPDHAASEHARTLRAPRHEGPAGRHRPRIDTEDRRSFMRAFHGLAFPTARSAGRTFEFAGVDLEVGPDVLRVVLILEHVEQFETLLGGLPCMAMAIG